MQLSLTNRQLGSLLGIMLVYPVIWLDAAYGVFSYFGLGALRISMLYRIIILLVGLYIAFTTSGLIGWLIKIMVLAWAALLLLSTYPDGNAVLAKDINHLLRRLYPFTVFIATLAFLSHFGDRTSLLIKGLAHYGVIFALVMLFSFVTGLGYESYGDYAFGIKSFFVGGNDIGLAAIISLAILFSQLYFNISLLNLARVGVTFIALMLLGTKAGWAASTFIAGCFAIIILFFLRSKNRYQRSLKWTVMSLVIALTVGIASYVQENFDDFKYQLQQAEQLLAGTSPRHRLIESYKRNEINYDESIQLLGDGGYFYVGVGREYYLVDNNKGTFDVFREVEQEWYDLTGAYGVPYAVFVFSFHGLFIFFATLLFFRRPSVENFALMLGLYIYLGHGIFAGHAFVSGQPSHLVGIIYAITFYRLQQELQRNSLSLHKTCTAQATSQ